MDAICQRRGLWSILYANFWQPLYQPFYASPSIARAWNIGMAFPRLLDIHPFLYYIVYKLYAFTWDVEEGSKSHVLSLTAVGGRCLDFPDLSCLKTFLCCPAIRLSQDWRGAVKSPKDSFSSLIPHGSISLILCGSEPESTLPVTFSPPPFQWFCHSLGKIFLPGITNVISCFSDWILTHFDFKFPTV